MEPKQLKSYETLNNDGLNSITSSDTFDRSILATNYIRDNIFNKVNKEKLQKEKEFLKEEGLKGLKLAEKYTTGLFPNLLKWATSPKYKAEGTTKEGNKVYQLYNGTWINQEQANEIQDIRDKAIEDIERNVYNKIKLGENYTFENFRTKSETAKGLTSLKPEDIAYLVEIGAIGKAISGVKLLKKPLEYAWRTYTTYKIANPENTIEEKGTNLALGWGDKIWKYGRIGTGGEDIRPIRNVEHPKAGRKSTEKRIENEDEIISSITGKGAGKSWYVGKPKYAGARKSRGYFANPFSSQINKEYAFRYGDFSLNPERNPTYWKRNIKKMLGIKEGKEEGYLDLPTKKIEIKKNPLDWTMKNQELLISKNKYEKSKTLKDIEKKYSNLEKDETISTTPPKTIRGYSQPEEEIFNIAKEDTKKNLIKTGKDPTGIKVYEEIPKETSFIEKNKLKLKRRLLNINNALKKQEFYERDTAERGKRKYNLLKEKNPEGEILDNSGNTHIRKIIKIGKKLKVKDENLLKAFAWVHDINKEKTLNFKNYEVISNGIKKGYYDFIPEIKKMNSEQKRYLANLVRYDERPVWNWHNIKNRPNELTEFGISLLDNEAKKIINADRIARFGNKADPNMMYEIKGSTKKPNEMIRENAEKISKREMKEQKEIEKLDKEYTKTYEELKENPKIQTYTNYKNIAEYYDPTSYYNPKTGYITGKYDYNNEQYPSEYGNYETPYEGYPTGYKPTPEEEKTTYGYSGYDKYGEYEPTKYTIYSPTGNVRNKPTPKRRIALPSSNAQITAWQPIMFLPNGEIIDPYSREVVAHIDKEGSVRRGKNMKLNDLLGFIGIAGFIGGALFLQSNITGNVIMNLTT